MTNWTEWQGTLFIVILPMFSMLALCYINGFLMKSRTARRIVRKIKKEIARFFLHYVYHEI